MITTIIRIVLLAFVAVALATALIRNVGGSGGAVERPETGMGPTGSASAGAVTTVSAPPAPASRLVAFYFHGTKRCTACNSIERLTREALKAETDAGRIDIRSVNVDEAPHAHYVEDLGLTMRTVVLAEEAGGRIVRWKHLDECWDRFGDPPDYLTYIQRSLAAFRAPAAAVP